LSPDKTSATTKNRETREKGIRKKKEFFKNRKDYYYKGRRAKKPKSWQHMRVVVVAPLWRSSCPLCVWVEEGGREKDRMEERKDRSLGRRGGRREIREKGSVARRVCGRHGEGEGEREEE
jgi:hypothetical protein